MGITWAICKEALQSFFKHFFLIPALGFHCRLKSLLAWPFISSRRFTDDCQAITMTKSITALTPSSDQLRPRKGALSALPNQACFLASCLDRGPNATGLEWPLLPRPRSSISIVGNGCKQSCISESCIRSWRSQMPLSSSSFVFHPHWRKKTHGRQVPSCEKERKRRIGFCALHAEQKRIGQSLPLQLSVTKCN